MGIINLKALVERCSQENSDDASIAVLRRNDVPEGRLAIYREVLSQDQDSRDHSFLDHVMRQVILEEIKQCVESGDYSGITGHLDYAEEYSLIPDMKTLISILDLIAQSSSLDRMVFDRISGMIRRI